MFVMILVLDFFLCQKNQQWPAAWALLSPVSMLTTVPDFFLSVFSDIRINTVEP